jgi:hypothetical protein
MATNILDVHHMRHELRNRLKMNVNDSRRMYASDISGPGLSLDFGSVASTWGQLMWNDNTDTWDITIGNGPVHKAKTVDDAVAYCEAAGKERGKKAVTRWEFGVNSGVKSALDGVKKCLFPGDSG